jgi:hypothetical protein
LPEGGKKFGHFFHMCGGVNPGFFGSLLDFLPMLVDAGEEIHRLALQSMKARDGISQHLLIGVTDVRRAIGVIDSRGYKKWLGHKKVSGILPLQGRDIMARIHRARKPLPLLAQINLWDS